MTESVRLQVEPAEVSVTPAGSPAQLKVRLVNATRIIDEFTVEAIGTGQWLMVAPERIRLFPDAEGSVDLALSIPSGVMVPAGTRVIGIRATSGANAQVSATGRVSVVVGAVTAEESLTLEPQVARGGSEGAVNVRARNRGNTPLNLTLRGEDPEGAMRFTFSPPSVLVPPGGEAWSQVAFSAPRSLSGREVTRSFTIRAEGGHAALVASGTFLQVPRVTRSGILATRLLLTFFGAAALIGGAFLRWTGPPSSLRGVDFDYITYFKLAFGADVSRPSTALSEGTMTFLTSGGLLALVLGGLALLGLASRNGLLTRLGAGLAFVVLVVVAITLAARSGAPPVAAGLLVCLAGSLAALIGGFMARRA
jgi:hypothetical protein